MNLTGIKNINIEGSDISFKGDPTRLLRLNNVANEIAGGFVSSITENVRNNAPRRLINVNDNLIVNDPDVIRRTISSVKSLFSMVTVDILDFVAKKTDSSWLNDLSFLRNHRARVELENEINALSGFRKTIASIAKEIDYPLSDSIDRGSEGFNNLANRVQNELDKKLNHAMADNAANYDTKRERLCARMVSGVTSGIFSSFDYYNKAIKQNKNTSEADEEFNSRFKQELKENLCEGGITYGISTLLSESVNANVMVSAFISAGVSFVARIISRKSDGKPIRRIKAPATAFKTNMPSISEFTKSIKDKNTNELFTQKQYEKARFDAVENKKPLLSMKNLLLAVGVSAVAGMGLSAIRNHTALGSRFVEFTNGIAERINRHLTYDFTAKKSELEELMRLLNEANESSLANKIGSVIHSADTDASNIVIGTEYIKTLGVKNKDIMLVLTIIPRFIKDLITKPYQIVDKIILTPAKLGLTKLGVNFPESIAPESVKIGKLRDIYDFKNIYKQYMRIKDKYTNPADANKIREEFLAELRRMKVASCNSISSSKGDNSKIGVVAQTVSTLIGIRFNTNDDYNTSIKNGASKKQAEKDGRIRGINKFYRMSVQVAISGTLNDMLSKLYNQSILGVGITVLLSTLLTDPISRLLSDMPVLKKSKAELDRLHEEKKDSRYSKFIDFLAS